MIYQHQKIKKESNTHYRTWKKGKNWCYSFSILAALTGGAVIMSGTASADVSTVVVAETEESTVSETPAAKEVPPALESLPVEASVTNEVSEDDTVTTIETVPDIAAVPAEETAVNPVVSDETATATAAADEISEPTQETMQETPVPTVDEVQTETESQLPDTAEAKTVPAVTPSSSAAFSAASALAVQANAITSEVHLLQGDTTTEQSPTMTVGGADFKRLGVKGNFSANKADLVAGNTIIIAQVLQTSTEASGALAALSGGYTTTLVDMGGNVVGTIQYNSTLKAITLLVTNTVTTGDVQNYSFEAPVLMVINAGTTSDVIAKMPFSNTLSVTENSYQFNFTKVNANDATTLVPDILVSGSSATDASFNSLLQHEDIPNNSVLNSLQQSGGETGAVLGNTGIKESFRISGGAGLKSLTTAAIYLGSYYVSATTNKIQALNGQTEAYGPAMIARDIGAKVINSGENLTIEQLQDLATSTGIYYSRQSDNSYLVVSYLSPEDSVMSEALIAADVRDSPLAAVSSDVEADVQATLAYYREVLKNRASYVQIYVGFSWADEYAANTLIGEDLNDGRTSTVTSVPNAIATGETPVKTHYVDLDGNLMEGTGIVTKTGAPTGKDNDLGSPGTSSATVDPLEISGYTLVTDITKLTTEQKAQLESQLQALGLTSSDMDIVSGKIIFATKSNTVPYPGFADKLYDAAGHIVSSGGTAGYGQTDVYYFYVANPQKVVYNVIDDTAGTNLETNADFDNGSTDGALNKSQQDLQDIANDYIPDGYEVVSVDTIPGAFDADDAVDQVVNIHLKHATSSVEETEIVNETIHYVYASDNSKAADDHTDSVTFTRTATTDLVTKEITYTAWVAEGSDTTFDSVNSPSIANYTPDQANVAAAVGLTADSEDIEVTVKYIVNTEAATDTQEVIRIIHYVYEDGTPVGAAAPDSKETLTFTRTGTKNLATGDITWNAWTGITSFPEVLSPDVKGYTVDRASVPEVTGLDGDSADITETVVYAANPQKIIYNVIDDTAGENLEIEVDFDNGVTNGALNKTQDDLQNIADGYIPDGYEIVSVDTLPTAFDDDDAVNQVVNIHLKHATSSAEETETVNETIHYVYASDNSKAADDYTDSVTFTRTATTDQVTKEITYTAWIAEDGDSSFDEVTSPSLKGYTVDRESVPEVMGLDGDSADIIETVVYTANAQKIVYNVIDDTTGETIEDTVDFDNGVTNGPLNKTQDDLREIADGYIPDGYEIVSVDTLPTAFDDDNAVNQVVNIHLKHVMEETTETEKVNETIHYVYEDGSEAAEDHTDKVTFIRTVTTDKVTGEITYGDWTSDDTTFDEVTSPMIDGYTADKLSIDEVTDLTAESEDSEVTVTYVKDEDEEGEPGEPGVPGKPDEPGAPGTSGVSYSPGAPAVEDAKVVEASVLPSTGDGNSSILTLAGEVAVLGAGVFLLGAANRLRRKKN